MTLEELVARLTPALGEDQALEMVHRALKALALREKTLQAAQQRAVLSWLGCREGLVGAIARQILQALEREAESPEVVTATVRISRDPVSPRPSLTSSATATSNEGVGVERRELVDVLSRTLGDQKAEEVVARACAKLRLSGDRFSLPAAHSLLETLAGEPGIVGVTARFAKARFAMRKR